MKKFLFIAFAVVLLTAFKIQNSGNATVQKMQGIDVYVMSEPTRKYEIIKTETAMQWLDCSEAIKSPINRAAKTEGAQGVIIYWPVSSKFSVIKYVE